jgi:hypothetical protein
VSSFKIYFDKDAMDTDLVAALRSRGIEILTVLELGLAMWGGRPRLRGASRPRCLHAHLQRFFYRLHTKWIGSGQEHAGMILVPQQRFSVGEQLRRLLRLRSGTATAGMRNRVEFLSNWD